MNSVKQILLTAVLMMMAATSFAYDVEVNGIYYNLNTTAGTAEVTHGTIRYSGDVVIPASFISDGKSYSMTSIGDYAFSWCRGLTAITIPNSITNIGEYAFEGCRGLTAITIPNSVTSIGYRAFYGCTSLTAIVVDESNPTYDSRENCNAIVETASNCLISGCKSTTIPNSVTSIGGNAFSGCSGLTTITIPNSVTSIGNYAFWGCTGLTAITIPSSVTRIGDSPFRGCTGLTAITIPSSVTRIGDEAFYGCTGLTDITIPESVTSIENGVFSGCSGLTAITIPNSVTSIGNGAFSGCTSLTAITIPNSVTSIGDYAFWECLNLTAITIPNSVTYIGDYAFAAGAILTPIIIPNSITNIGEYAFSDCIGLTAITIPNSTTRIGNGAFSGCSGLTDIVVDESNPIYDSRENCNAIVETASNCLICGCKSTTIPNSVTSIGNAVFQGCTGLTAITIPNSTTSIGSRAFDGCTSLTDITIPNSVTSIGNWAFDGCTSLTAVTIGSGTESISNGAFYGCSNLSEVICLAETVPNTNTYAFQSSPIKQATLYVPASALTSYQTTKPWSQFGIIKTIEERKEACATPSIRFEDGALRFECETDGAQFHYTITAQDVQAEEAYATDGIVPLTGCYDITCYATAELYLPSETVTAQLYWIEPANEATSINPTPMRGITVQSVHGFVTITGLAEYEHISYYNTAGAYLGTAESIDGTATFTAPANTIVVVKIGTQSIKVNVR